jgi:hypothetical protein
MPTRGAKAAATAVALAHEQPLGPCPAKLVGLHW